MLCLNKLGIGGVETAVINQLIELSKRKFRVIVLVDDGIYSSVYEKLGAIIEKIQYNVENKYDTEKIRHVMEIIEKYNVEQVHIHQFDCINTVFPACIIKNIPYVAYAHTGITGVYDWFENSYVCYKEMFKLYFKCAKKIIAITEQAKRENQNKYKIENEKYIVIRNSINFNNELLQETYIPSKIEKFLIISRFSNEKMVSIKNSILIFKKYYEYDRNAKLTIVGDGECRQIVEEEVEDIKQSVEFLGERNDVMKIIAKNDVVLALDRCILETIIMKKIAVISGYDGIKGIVLPEVIDVASESNFSGRNLETKTEEEVIEDLKKLSNEKIKDIVERNYDYAYENLNSSKNLYIIEDTKNTSNGLKTSDAMEEIIELQNLYANYIVYTDNLYVECKKTQSWLEDKVNNMESQRQKETSNLKKELSEIISQKQIEIDNLKIDLSEMKNQNKMEINDLSEKINQKQEKINYLSKIITQNQMEIDSLRNELNCVYQSRTWKIANGIRKIIKREK